MAKDIVREGTTTIEVYRANQAAPLDWEALRFWTLQELVKIQSSFTSTDEVIRALRALIGTLETEGGTCRSDHSNG